jgi:FtsH-binding integral membrane protein
LTGKQSTYDPELARQSTQFSQSHQDLKRDFIVKVYSILTTQILITAGFAALCCGYEPLQKQILSFFMKSPTGFMVGFLIVDIVCICALMYHKDKYPLNFGLLSIFTLCNALYIGIICAAYAGAGKGNVVAAAGGTTALIFVLLTGYVKWSGRDFSFMGPFLFVALMANILFGLVCWIFALGAAMFAYHVFGVLIFSAYIIYDTDQICNRTDLEDMDTGNAIIGAVDLYLDIINLFLHLLAIFDRFS